MIKPPYEYQNFYVFDNVILDDLRVSDCVDTIDGECKTNVSLNECIKICSESDDCNNGYYIKAIDKSFCVPLRKSLRNDTFYYSRLKPKNIYPELLNLDTNVFVKKEEPFPPDRANTVFYTDKLMLKNVKTGKILGIGNRNKKESGDDAIFDNRNFDITILPTIMNTDNSNIQYIPVKNNENINFNIIGSSRYLTGKKDGSIVFQKRTEFPTYNFQIITSSTKKAPLYYGEQFQLLFDNKTVVYDETANTISLIQSPQNANNLFTLVPDFDVFYKIDSNCNPIPLSSCDVDGVKAKYKNNICYRNNTCWIYNPITNIFKLILKVILFVFVIFLFYKFFKKEILKFFKD